MNKSLVKKIVVGLVAIAPVLALAQITLPQPTGGVNIGSVGQFSTVLQSLARLIGSLIMAISVFVVLYAGWLFLTAGDNEETHGKAKAYITYGIIGIVVALIAFSIPTLVASLLGGTVLN